MPVSPQDYELYSRATGTPLPQTPQEKALLAPDVYRFTRSASTRPSLLKNLGKAAALAGGAALVGYGAKHLKDNPIDWNLGTGARNITANDDFLTEQEANRIRNIQRSGEKVLKDIRNENKGDNDDDGGSPVTVSRTPPKTPPSGGSGGATINKGHPYFTDTDSLPSSDAYDADDFYEQGGLVDDDGPVIDRVGKFLGESPTPGEQLNQQQVGNQTEVVEDTRYENNALIDNNSITNNEAYQSGGAITPTPAQGISTSATTNLNIVNPLTHGGQFLQVDPSQKQTDEGLQEVPRTATFRPDVQLGMPAPLRPAMQNLGQDLSRIWNPQRAGFQFLDQGTEHAHHGLLDGVGGALATAGLDATMPEVGIPVHLARMAGGVVGGLGPLAGHGIRGLETIGTVGKAVAQQAAGDVMDTLRIGAHPAGQAARWAIRKGGRDIERGIEDITKYGPDMVNRATQGLGLAAKLAQEKGERDWALSKGLINAAGERISRFGVEIGEDHLANDNPDTPGEEQDMAPSRSIHEPVDDSGVEQINDPWDSDKESSITSFRSSPSYKSVVTGGNDELVGGTPQEVPSPIEESAPSARDRSDSFIDKLTAQALNETRFEAPNLTQEFSPDIRKNPYAEAGLTEGGDIYTKYKGSPDQAYVSKTHPEEAEAFEDLQKRGELTGEDGVNPSLLVDALLDRTKRKIGEYKQGAEGWE